MNYKNIKIEAKKNLKRNYFKNVLVVFLCSILLYGGLNLTTKNILEVDLRNKSNVEKVNNYKENSEILDELLSKSDKEKKYEEYISNNYTHGVISKILNEVTKTNSPVFTLLNGINKILGGKISAAIIIILANILIILIRVFFLKVVEVGKNRYFLEERRYKVELDSCLYPYKKKKNFKMSLILLKKEIYLFLWSFTIIGFFIKLYEYSMIPYILAENPNISSKDAFTLSKELTNNQKFNMFKIDLTLLVYKILGLFTFNLLNIFYTNIYKETIYSEIYIKLRNNKKDNLELGYLLNDELLNINEIKDTSYPKEERTSSLLHIDYDKNYSLTSYILLFFTFSIIGWMWEVILHLVNNGVFVNRGTMHGPWLPIYGWGGLTILILLKSFRKKPWKLFFMSFLTCGIIEYSTAWYLETFKHLRYWNYNGYFLNIKGRVCLEGLILFGLGGMVFTYLLAPLLDNLFKKLTPKVTKIICIILITSYLVDFVYTIAFKPNTGKGVSSPVKKVVESNSDNQIVFNY